MFTGLPTVVEILSDAAITVDAATMAALAEEDDEIGDIDQADIRDELDENGNVKAWVKFKRAKAGETWQEKKARRAAFWKAWNEDEDEDDEHDVAMIARAKAKRVAEKKAWAEKNTIVARKLAAEAAAAEAAAVLLLPQRRFRAAEKAAQAAAKRAQQAQRAVTNARVVFHVTGHSPPPPPLSLLIIH